MVPSKLIKGGKVKQINRPPKYVSYIETTEIILTSLIEYVAMTVSYARELTSVYICYSQGDGFNTSLSRLLPESVVSVVSVDVCIRDPVWYVWLCSVVRPCATQDDVNKGYV